MKEVRSSTGDVVASLRSMAKSEWDGRYGLPECVAKELIAAISEILKLKRKAAGREILLREIERLQSENARLRGLCGLSPKQPIPEMMS
jgi:hypothetical protein